MTESAQLLLTILKDAEAIRITLLTNVVKMLIARKWINKIEWEQDNGENTDKMNQFLEHKNENNQYVITVNNGICDSNLLYIFFVFQKLSSIINTPIVMDFTKNYPLSYKILVIDDITDKTLEYLHSMHNLEVFKKNFFTMNIMKFCAQPKFEVLTEEEEKKFVQEYKIKHKQMLWLLSTDPVAIYYGLKKKQIVRIIRPSPLTGESITYRCVVGK